MSKSIVSNHSTTNKTYLFSIRELEAQINLLKNYFTDQDRALLLKEATDFLNGHGSYKKIKTDDNKYEHYLQQVNFILRTTKSQEKNQFMFKQRLYETLAVAACVVAVSAMIVGVIVLMTINPFWLLMGLTLGLLSVGGLSFLAVSGAVIAFVALEENIDKNVPKFDTTIRNGNNAYNGLIGFFNDKNSQNNSVDEPALVGSPASSY